MVAEKRVLVIYFSFSSQTRNLIRSIIAGLEEKDMVVRTEVIRPVEPLHFPLGNYFRTVRMMLLTSIRQPRMEIEPIGDQCLEEYDLVLLAGPTWSYNPSAPMLSFLRRDGKRVLRGKKVVPLISCRGYWRLHLWGLKRLLRRCQATILAPIIFTHTTSEPWRTIGVFLKMAGKVPESNKSWFRRFYPKYGHNRDQIATARLLGTSIAISLKGGKKLEEMSFETPVPFKRVCRKRG